RIGRIGVPFVSETRATCQIRQTVGKYKTDLVIPAGPEGPRMINRIRALRRQTGTTPAEVAARRSPPTTAQTIGRLQTGTPNLSLGWMDRIAAALGVEPKLLLRGEDGPQPQLVARLGEYGAEALPAPRDAILPTAL